MGIWLFKRLIEALHNLTFGMLPGWAALFAPIPDGLLVGGLAGRWLLFGGRLP